MENATKSNTDSNTQPSLETTCIIFSSCLEDVLQEIIGHQKENVLQNKLSGNQDDEPLLPSEESSYNHDDPSLTKDNIPDETQVKNIPEEQQMKKEGPGQLKLLRRFRNLKNGLEDGVNAATTLFGGMQKAGGGIFGMLSDGAQSFLQFD